MHIEEIFEVLTPDAFVIADTHFGHKNVLRWEKSRREAVEQAGYSITDEGHTEWLVNNWNSVVTDDDFIFVLGDFAFNKVWEYSAMLKGKKIIIFGNHDKYTTQNLGWKDHGWGCVDGFYQDTISMNIIKYIPPLEYQGLSPSGLYTSMSVRDEDAWIPFSKRSVNLLLTHQPMFTETMFGQRQEKEELRLSSTREFFAEEIDLVDYNIHGHIHSKVTDCKEEICVSVEQLPEFKPIRLKELLN